MKQNSKPTDSLPIFLAIAKVWRYISLVSFGYSGLFSLDAFFLNEKVAHFFSLKMSLLPIWGTIALFCIIFGNALIFAKVIPYKTRNSVLLQIFYGLLSAPVMVYIVGIPSVDVPFFAMCFINALFALLFFVIFQNIYFAQKNSDKDGIITSEALV